ncbi:MAG: hypothetical protein K1X53_16420, partial [Candidatus Sumerlaeaceae bacterium]|nr:hypothetical protein [Candidatus Sumerlaeaceae bacterium]
DLTLPEYTTPEGMPAGWSLEKKEDSYGSYWNVLNGGNIVARNISGEETARATAWVKAKPKPDSFRSTHFDQPNILAHVRFNERVDSDGKRVLFIEEIQSDWHQAGRKRGYQAGDLLIDRKTAAQWQDEAARRFDAGDTVGMQEASRNARILRDRATERGFAQGQAVPDAPFKATDEWAMLAFKRMVRMAAENGFDRIAWTTGEQQADRYDLSKQVDRIDYTKTPSGDIIPEIFQTGGGKVPLPKRVYSPDELADVVGKEIAERIANDGNDGSSAKMRSLSGDGLKVGGSGMRAFYDKILPSAVNKWAKKFGGKVGQAIILTDPISSDVPDVTPITDDGEVPREVHAIDITPAMRDAAMAGQPLFSRAPAEELASIEADMRAVAAAADGGDGVVARIKQWLKDATPKELKDRLRGTWLGALTTRMLTTLGQDYFPTMRLYTDFLAEMQASRNEMQQEGEDVAETVRKWADKNRQEAERLFDTMHEATIAGVDPAEAYQPLTFKAGKQWIEVNKQNVKDRIAVLRDNMFGRGGDSKKRPSRTEN